MGLGLDMGLARADMGLAPGESHGQTWDLPGAYGRRRVGLMGEESQGLMGVHLDRPPRQPGHVFVWSVARPPSEVHATGPLTRWSQACVLELTPS
jgi:hypothetical protein